MEQAALLSAHVVDLANPIAARVWQRRAARSLAHARPVFEKTLSPIGSRASDGFGGGMPDLRRRVLLAAWVDEDRFEAFCDVCPDESAGALFDVVTTHGAHYAKQPLRGHENPAAGRFGTLTLGRASWRSLPRFLREGSRLDAHIHSAPGLVAAVSAGNPLTGNCTLSLWRTEEDMVRFAYRDAAGHRRAARTRPPILVEQLTARLRARRLFGPWQLADDRLAPA